MSVTTILTFITVLTLPRLCSAEAPNQYELLEIRYEPVMSTSAKKDGAWISITLYPNGELRDGDYHVIDDAKLDKCVKDCCEEKSSKPCIEIEIGSDAKDESALTADIIAKTMHRVSKAYERTEKKRGLVVYLLSSIYKEPKPNDNAPKTDLAHMLDVTYGAATVSKEKKDIPSNQLVLHIDVEFSAITDAQIDSAVKKCVEAAAPSPSIQLLLGDDVKEESTISANLIATTMNRLSKVYVRAGTKKGLAVQLLSHIYTGTPKADPPVAPAPKKD